uniref:FLYWCH-type domain-containing protein n=1 Tax=Phytophthora ramorum TaxID=164328 RepID=H3GWZ2_PHYRM
MSARKVLDQSAAIQDSRFTTTMILEGFQYTKASISSRKTSYRCSYYRSAGCKGKVDLITRTKKFTNFIEHTCERGDDIELQTPDPTTSGQNLLPVSHLAAEVTAAQNVFQPPVFTPAARNLAIQIDPNLLGQIEMPPLSLVRNTTMNFFHFNCMNGYGANNTPNRVIGWAHPHLLELLKHANSTIYIDTSFRRLPPGFELFCAVVVHDKPSGFFVPVFYVLGSTRTLRIYRNALSFIIQATRRKLNPAEVVCDFDVELHSALQAQFPNAVVRGSVYLFKHDCRARMERLQISEEAVNIAMEKGVLDMLVSIPPGRVATAGIAWVTQQIKTKCVGAGVPYAQDQWRSFWVYFKCIWTIQFPPAMWNLHDVSSSIIARTSNPLQQFHRELDSAFASPDPGLLFFVATIERMARRHVADLAAETTTLPRRVEVFSEEEHSSHEGVESDGDDDTDDGLFKIESSCGHEGGVNRNEENESEEAFD